MTTKIYSDRTDEVIALRIMVKQLNAEIERLKMQRDEPILKWPPPAFLSPDSVTEGNI